MSDSKSDKQQKLLLAKMVLDNFTVPNRPVTLSAYQYKKKFGTNLGYTEYKKQVKNARAEWDKNFKEIQKTSRLKSKHLAEVQISDEAFKQANIEASQQGVTVSDILSNWLEKGRNSSN